MGVVVSLCEHVWGSVRKRSRGEQAQLRRKASARPRIKRPKSVTIKDAVRELPNVASTPVRLTIDAPEFFSFESNHLEVLEFLANLRYEASRSAGVRQLVIDLAPIRHLELAASLALVAEFDRWQRYRETKLTPLTLANWHPSVVNRLVMLGFFRLLKTNVPEHLITKPADFWIPFTSGVLTVGLAAKRLRERLEYHLGVSTGLNLQIYASLVESMKNAYQHAYPDGDTPAGLLRTVGRRWWMTGKVDPDENTIDLVFLDQGITVPCSLPNSWLWAELDPATRNAATSDGARIVQAMRYGRSRLAGQTHRGKGFHDIRFPVLLDPRNTLRIFSRAGMYEEVGGLGLASNNTEAFGGTLIAWHLHIPSPMV